MSERELGDYNLIKQLGRGSLGTVYLAEHRYMQKQYALKLLPEELASDRGFIQRFQEDVGRLAALHHPNLVAIHNISFCDGIYFLVTDCVVDSMGESTNLQQYLKQRKEPLSEELLFQQLMGIAEALDYAHHVVGEGKPLIHRGIKLNNILIGYQGDKEVWSLSDFGLSRIIGCGAVLARACRVVADTLSSPAFWVQAGNEGARYPFPPLDAPSLTLLQSSFLQHFAFLAPEQKAIDGVAGITHQADTYAFGMLCYYLLTHRFPEGFFPMPSEVRGGLCYRWDGLIRGCLQASPSQRPNNLVAALNGVRDLPSLSSESGLISSESILEAYRQPEGVVRQDDLERREGGAPLVLTEMIVVEGGRFLRGSIEGSRDEMPCHEVQLETFAIDIHPVTNEQFIRFLESVNSEKDSFHRDLIRLRDARIKRANGKLSIESGYAKHPVVGITWYGAMAYAKWAGRRLPTEAEWEIAAAGGKAQMNYPTGEDIEKSEANFFSSDTTGVMSYPPNTLGLYDMAGNVYEWCYDWYGYNYYETSQQEPHNPTGPLQGNYRVLRGGCWKSLKEDLRCAKRHRNNPGALNSTYGFRCAATVRS